MSEFRLDKLAEQIREEISQLIFSGKIKDPRVTNFLSINRVEVSGDLAYAKVYVSSFMDIHKTKQGIYPHKSGKKTAYPSVPAVYLYL